MRLPFFPAAAGDSPNSQISTAWLITFTDLVGLLLAFFIMLFAMSAPDEEQWAKLAKLFAGEATMSVDSQPEVPAPESARPTRVPSPDGGLSTDYLASLLLAKLATEPSLVRARVEPGADHVALVLDAALLLENGVVPEAALSRVAAIRGLIGALPNAVQIEMHAAGRAHRPQAWSEAAAQASAVAEALTAAGYARPLPVRAYVDETPEGGADRVAIVISE